ncbi:histone acetyltransferase, MYST family [Myriangium duriaei CBS 260.36]|uniref:histone acetyltransferase n=1 Tax=Myriangium duriaei CBS 260.36 TaxID=1168546 RepID=A0A9P4MEG6_9PEZI|nr:histone acetyltransferase, MYST family [Myriangium duriaei CBS 260.36]
MASSPTLPRSPERTRKHAERNVMSVVLGNLLIKPWYPSFYPQESIGRIVDRLYICQWCFRYSKELMPFVAHTRTCPLKDSVPPGNLIYEHDGVAVYEIDGSEHKLYTQNLSLFAKLFLDTKSVFFDVTTFRFYVMTLHDPATTQTQIVGFFSKEKMSWDNNNLACILVFPPWQRRGFGQLLIAVSYELSRRDGRLGGPEKPLSSLGRKGYLAYWSANISRAILSTTAEKLSVQDIVEQTWILPEDVITTLTSMNLVEPSPKAPAEAIIVRKRVSEWVQTHNVTLQSPIVTNAFKKEIRNNTATH